MTVGALAAGCQNTDIVPEARDVETGGGRASVRQDSASVAAVVETEPVPHGDDAADDPAIWVDPADPSRSAVIGTDKDGGLAVYDLDGKQLQYLPDGELNNVDLRDGFSLGGAAVTLVTAGNRRNNTIAVYRFDPVSRQLQDVAARPLGTGVAIYGSCMYRSKASQKTYFFATSEDGDIEQWELFDSGGRVDGREVRTLRPDSDKSEGCVADDDLSRLYVGEEEAGIWRYGAEPDSGEERTRVDSTGDGHLVADVEGLTVVKGPDDGGWLVASSQGDSSFVLYERDGDNEFIRRFRVGGAGSVDGVEETDGIDGTSADLGGRFTGGLFVVQDGSNPGANQNFKLVAWDSIVSTN
jgi:3-phytase